MQLNAVNVGICLAGQHRKREKSAFALLPRSGWISWISQARGATPAPTTSAASGACLATLWGNVRWSNRNVLLYPEGDQERHGACWLVNQSMILTPGGVAVAAAAGTRGLCRKISLAICSDFAAYPSGDSGTDSCVTCDTPSAD